MMRSSLFRNTALILLLLLMTISGSAQRMLFSIYQTQHWNFPFGEGFDKVLYKGTIDVKDKHMTGLLLAKKTSDTTIRVVFSNEVGMRFFDIEYTGEKPTVHYIFPSMNKKAFISILTDDIRMVFLDDMTINKFSKEAKPEIIRYTTQSSRGTTLYTVEPETYKLMNMSTSGKKMKKTIINFEYGKKQYPVSVNIENPFIGMKIRLNLLSEE